ncbi:YbaN family protein [Pelagibius sp.]|uniref:YbaN family protein n=1 Tax=Pelagibius sp. TaxID=1931238 RepID=UPI003B509D32
MSGSTAAQDSAKQATAKSAEAAERSRRNWAWTGAGYGFFVIGLVGLVLPVMPTTIFWIAAAACFAKSCPAMQQRIFAWPGVGPSVEAYLLHGVVEPRSKRAAMLGMMLATVIMIMLSDSAVVNGIGSGLILLGALYVITRPSSIPSS